jgi:hypothetical protein
MSTREQARALMMRHHQLIKNRQQCLLSRAAAEVGLHTDENTYQGRIQGKFPSTFQADYDPSHAALS